MNSTQTTLNSASEDRRAERKAVIGGGWITTPAVAAHTRRRTDTIVQVPQGQPAQRKAVVGGGWVTTPAVAAHVRRGCPTAKTGSRPINELT